MDEERRGSVDKTSWGMLVAHEDTALFLWFPGPDDMADNLHGLVRSLGRQDSTSAVREIYGRYSSGEADVLSVLEILVETIGGAPAGEHPPILWWGPVSDLMDREEKTPSLIRSWFRKDLAGRDHDTAGLGSPLDVSEREAFIGFIDRISFGGGAPGDDPV